MKRFMKKSISILLLFISTCCYKSYSQCIDSSIVRDANKYLIKGAEAREQLCNYQELNELQRTEIKVYQAKSDSSDQTISKLVATNKDSEAKNQKLKQKLTRSTWALRSLGVVVAVLSTLLIVK
jgi:ferric iron reductase protein FhuF